MINLSDAHPYTRAIFHASNVARTDDEIIHFIKKYCPNADAPIIHRQNHAQAYCLRSGARTVYAINGTDGTIEDWINNFVAGTTEEWHKGVSEEYYKDLAPWIREQAKYDTEHRREIDVCTHSQGTGEGNLAVLDVREMYRSYGPDIEQIGFGGLRMHTPAGIMRMKLAGCRVTHLMRPDDPVPKIGGIQYKYPFKFRWTEHYGYKVKLPAPNKTKWPYGHAWSNYMISLAEWYRLQNKFGEVQALKEIMEVAKI